MHQKSNITLFSHQSALHTLTLRRKYHAKVVLYAKETGCVKGG